MAYYGNNYCEKEVIRESEYDSSSRHPIGHRHHNNMVSDVIGSDVIYESNAIPSYDHRHNRHNHEGAEIIERTEEQIIYENECDPCRRIY